MLLKIVDFNGTHISLSSYKLVRYNRKKPPFKESLITLQIAIYFKVKEIVLN